MPSNQQLAQWNNAPSTAPKHVKSKLPKHADYVPPAAEDYKPAPTRHPITEHTGKGVPGMPSWMADNLEREHAQASRPDSADDQVRAGVTLKMSGPFSLFPEIGWRSASEAEKENEAKADADQATVDREKRADVLGMSTGALNTTAPMLKEMTEERYNELTPRQRAAVDFNTALSTAVRKDKHRQDEYSKNMTDQQVATYNTTVTDMFGAEGGSSLRAPETVALLRQLKIEDTDADLDQYLGLKVAVSGKDLKNLNNVTDMRPSDLVPLAGNEPEGIKQVQGALIDATLDTQQYLEKGDKLIQDIQSSMANDRLEDLKFLGAQPHKPGPELTAPGYGGSEMDSWFNESYNTLADKRSASQRPQLMTEMLAKVQANGADPQDFIDYVGSRIKNSQWYGEQVGDNPEGKYPSADKLRVALGLEE